MNYSLFKIIIILSIFGLVLPSFSLAQNSLPQTAGPPESFEEMKTTGLSVIKSIGKTLVKIWQEGIGWIKKIWNSYIYPFSHKIWQKIDAVFGKEIKEREPTIKEEFKKETQELKQEAPSLMNSLWGKIKEFFKFK